MQKNDSEFLLWLAKRLVYKYKESTDTIDAVQNIIKKYSLEQSLYQDICLNIHKDLTIIVNNLSNLNQSLINQIHTNQKEITQIKTENSINQLFENIDFDKLMFTKKKT